MFGENEMYLLRKEVQYGPWYLKICSVIVEGLLVLVFILKASLDDASLDNYYSIMDLIYS